MDDSEAAEMAALRRSKQFQNHQGKYGNRKEIKDKRQTELDERERRESEAIRKQLEQLREQADEPPVVENEEANGDDEDDDGFVPPQRPQEEEEDDDPMRSMFPTSFGHVKQQGNGGNVHDRLKRKEPPKPKPIAAAVTTVAAAAAAKGMGRGPRSKLAASAAHREYLHATAASASASSGGENNGNGEMEAPSDDDDEDSGSDQEFGPAKPESAPAAADAISKLPISHEVDLKGHTKAVSAIALDPSGARVLTGGYDESIKFYDFGGMNELMQSFREIEVEEGHPIRYLQYNHTGSLFFVCTGSAKPKVYDRDGFEQCQFVRGDPYIHDKRFTKGHVSGVNSGHWHPQEKEQVATCGKDGTIRIWNINKVEQNLRVAKLRAATGRNVDVFSCAFSNDGRMIAGAGADGSIQIWKSNGTMIRPDMVARGAHQPDTCTSGLVFSPDDTMLVSRGGDSTMRLWDTRKILKPVHTWSDLENLYAETNVIFSPNNSGMVVTTTSNKSRRDKGKVIFFDTKTLNQVQSVAVTPESAIRVLWHPTLNQIFVTCSDLRTRLLYSPDLSKKGALMCVGKAQRKKDPSDFFEYFDIDNPHSLPLFKPVNARTEKYKERRRRAEHPEAPLKGTIGSGGRRITGTYTQFLVKNIVQRKMDSKNEDPREEILKFADEAQKDPFFFRSYLATQPKPIFQEPTDESDDTSFSELSNDRKK